MRRLNPRIRAMVFGGLAILILTLYLVRPPWAAALHWWPMVVWTPVVFLPFLSLRFRALTRPFLMGLLLWAWALHLVREPSALFLTTPRARKAGEFRIVSLNCAAGTVEAAREAFGMGADLVLLQEVGERRAFVEAGRAAGYPYVAWSVDDAVFARTPLTGDEHEIDFAVATVKLGERNLRVMSLRLAPPVFRLDLWSPTCWREYAEDARQRRKRLQEILPHEPCLVGGDFNATDPRLVTDVHPAWTEAGRAAGRGWRGTGTNDFPFVAVDQIWASTEFRWTQAFVRKTANSDHRMLVADFEST